MKWQQPGCCGSARSTPVVLSIKRQRWLALRCMRVVLRPLTHTTAPAPLLPRAQVRIRRPADYNAAAAAPLGPSMPNPNLNLAAIGLDKPAAAAMVAPAAPINLAEMMAAPAGAPAPAMGGVPPGMTAGQMMHQGGWAGVGWALGSSGEQAQGDSSHPWSGAGSRPACPLRPQPVLCPLVVLSTHPAPRPAPPCSNTSAGRTPPTASSSAACPTT